MREKLFVWAERIFLKNSSVRVAAVIAALIVLSGPHYLNAASIGEDGGRIRGSRIASGNRGPSAELTALNVEVMDGPAGATWRIKEQA